MLTLLIAVIVAAVIFDFINGFLFGVYDGFFTRLERRAEGDGDHHARARVVCRGGPRGSAGVDVAGPGQSGAEVGGDDLRERDRVRHHGRRKKIIKTMGSKIIRISPLQGFAAETAGALTIFGASQLGIPVSTTHCINACIMGAGASKRVSAVRWGVAGNIVVAWVLTIPLAALAAYAVTFVLTRLSR